MLTHLIVPTKSRSSFQSVKTIIGVFLTLVMVLSSVPFNFTIASNHSDADFLDDNIAEEPATFRVVATKIVCDREIDLPNWGNGTTTTQITSLTAQDYIAANADHCRLADWDFQWAPKHTSNPGDNLGEASSPWVTFSNSITIDLNENLNKIWLREVWNDDYIPFTGVNTNQDVSAEFYCGNDVLHYDNYDFISQPQADKTYYCVGFNVAVSENTPPVITLIGDNPLTITVGNPFTDPGATALDPEDGDITANIVATSTVDHNTVGSYEITYNVSDSDGLAATPVTRIVKVVSGGGGRPTPPANSCIPRISIEDQYSVLIANQDVYFHPTVHKQAMADWVLANDGKPWGDTKPVDIDLTQTPGLTAVPTTPRALLITETAVYLHDDLSDLSGASWLDFNFNQPWRNEILTNVGVTHTRDSIDENLWAVVSVGSEIYFLATDPSSPHGQNTWVNISKNKPWGENKINDVDVTSQKYVYVMTDNGKLYFSSNPHITTQSDWALADPDSLITISGAIRFDGTFRPGTASVGSEIFYHLAPSFSSFNWYSITDNQPWGERIIDDVAVFFFSQEEPWATPAIVALVADSVPYLHLKPEKISDGDWFDVSDNAPWNTLGSSCSSEPEPPQCLVPEITSILTAQATVSQSFSYQITALGSLPTDYSLATSTTLPDGLSFSDDKIFGTPAETGIFEIGFAVTNACGIDEAILVLTITQGGGGCVAPTIISATSSSGVVGQPFTFTLDTTGTPSVNFSVSSSTPLPSGLELANGNKIIGTPTEAGIFDIEIIAENNCGTDSVVLTINIGSNQCEIFGNQTGWYGEYFDYSASHSDMQISSEHWSDDSGDPLSANATWQGDWYNNQYFKFWRVDSDLDFGNDFFPMNAVAGAELINDKNYHFGVHWQAQIMVSVENNYSYVLTSDDDAWVYVDGELVANNHGIHTPTTLSDSVYLTTGVHKVDVFFAERHTTQSHLTFKFHDDGIKVIPFADQCPLPQNTPPVITLIGDNPLTITVGNPFTDPGATALDPEDGDITANIVATSTVDHNTVGSYEITYNVSDSDGLAATPVTRIVKVVSGGGGGNGGGGGGGTRTTISHTPLTGQVLSATSCFYLRDFLKIDWQNDPVEVIKLQAFLRSFEGFTNLAITGVFDQATYEAVKVFQFRYFDEVLAPWGHDDSTGFVYITTRKKINEIFCQRAFPVSETQQAEINSFRAFLQSLGSFGVKLEEISGATTLSVSSDLGGVVLPDVNGEIGQATSTEATTVVTGGNFRNFAAAVLATPITWSGKLNCALIFLLILALIYMVGTLVANRRAKDNELTITRRSRKLGYFITGVVVALIITVLFQIYCVIIPLLLILIILALGYLWYSNRQTPIINKELDLTRKPEDQ